MTFSIIFSMISLSFAMSISPGPVNILIISSSINHGFKKTFSFISGATIGFTLLLTFIALGFISFLAKYPLFLQSLSILGSLFIVYLGYKIATSDAKLNIEKNNKNTLKFYQGFLLQWLNPKAWMACIAGVSIYSSSSEMILIFIVIYFFLCYICLCFWGFLGKKLQIILHTKKRLRIFNALMGAVLIITALYLLINSLT
ncbi:MAG: lysine transporter LysE [Proteobacteria bacterium]|nr:MAG: lysine transporter LysE [Pseudomonadota bacterium]